MRFVAPVLQELDMELHCLSTPGNNTGIFSSQLNKESTVRLLNSFPTYDDGETRNFTLGIHVDHQYDEEVLAAIANAEAKGWTLTVRWNGTLTSSASTFAMRTLIYANVGEMQLPDGTTEKFLDWGHYVTNPEDYQEFSSLEDAREYFGISEEN